MATIHFVLVCVVATALSTPDDLPVGADKLPADQQQLLQEVRAGRDRARELYSVMTMRATSEVTSAQDGWTLDEAPQLSHEFTTELIYRQLEPWRLRVEGAMTHHRHPKQSRTGLSLRNQRDYWNLMKNAETGNWFVTDAGKRPTSEPDWRFDRLSWFARAPWEFNLRPDPLVSQKYLELLSVTEQMTPEGQRIVEVLCEQKPMYPGGDMSDRRYFEEVFRYMQVDDLYLVHSLLDFSKSKDEQAEYRKVMHCEYDGSILTRIVYERSVRMNAQDDFAPYRRCDIAVNSIDFTPPAETDMEIASLIDVVSRTGIRRPAAARRGWWLFVFNTVAISLLVVLFRLRKRQRERTA